MKTPKQDVHCSPMLVAPDSRPGSHLLGLAGAVGRPALAHEQPSLLLLPEAIGLAFDVDGGRVMEQAIDGGGATDRTRTSGASTRTVLTRGARRNSDSRPTPALPRAEPVAPPRTVFLAYAETATRTFIWANRNRGDDGALFWRLRGTSVGRVLAVNCAQPAPTGPKAEAFSKDLSDRCHWGSLADVAAPGLTKKGWGSLTLPPRAGYRRRCLWPDPIHWRRGMKCPRCQQDKEEHQSA